jgi:IclR family pca regulon transcriptional regulator
MYQKDLLMPRLNDVSARERSERKMDVSAQGADFSEALARGLRLLTAFSAERPRMTLAEAARAVDLPRATVRRSLVTLVQMGYLHMEGRNFELTPSVLTLASAYLTSNPVSRVLQQVCDDLCKRVDESCSVAVLDGPDAVMIARAVPNQLIAIGAGIGYRVPALQSALGRVLLAGLADDARTAYLDRYLGDVPPADTERITQRILDAREAGFAYVDREAEAGYHSVAVPLRRWDGAVVASLNIGSSVQRVSSERMISTFLPALLSLSDELSGQLI